MLYSSVLLEPVCACRLVYCCHFHFNAFMHHTRRYALPVEHIKQLPKA